MWTLRITAFVTALCFATTASAQDDSDNIFFHPTMGGLDVVSLIDSFYPPGSMPLRDRCLQGDKDSCFTLNLGECASEDPRIAIGACSRQLRPDYSVRQQNGGRKLRAAVFGMRGAAYFKEGNIEDAIDDFNESILVFDGNFWVYANLATAQFDTGQYEEALHSIDAAINLLPNSPLLLSGRARLLATTPDENMRNAQQAIYDARTAISFSGENVPVHIYDTLAVAHAANGTFDQAVEFQQHAIAQLPSENEAELADYQNRLDEYLLQQYLRTPPSD
jgi:tetratricopeptide (TPR) repeat protein